MRTLFVSCVAVGLVASSAWAQSFNIDVGNLTPTPSAGYGAAANSAGVWNTYAGGVLPNLVTLNGSATSVSMSGTAGGFLSGFNDPGTFGDDEALMDDSMVVPVLETYTVSGLVAGTYNVYVYVWTFNALPTGIQVNGQGYQAIGGAWPNGFAAGVTHAVVPVTLLQGQDLIIDVHTINGALGGFSGLQIVEVPGPSVLAAVLAGGLRLRRRR